MTQAEHAALVDYRQHVFQPHRQPRLAWEDETPAEQARHRARREEDMRRLASQRFPLEALARDGGRITIIGPACAHPPYNQPGSASYGRPCIPEREITWLYYDHERGQRYGGFPTAFRYLDGRPVVRNTAPPSRKVPSFPASLSNRVHRAEVEEALAKGLRVPARVLLDYPDLAARVNPRRLRDVRPIASSRKAKPPPPPKPPAFFGPAWVPR